MCGIFGIFGHDSAAEAALLGLHALQHRGQESAGLAVADGQQVRGHHVVGLAQAGFGPGDLAVLRGHAAIGHVRYSTVGGTGLRNAQPILGELGRGPLALVHNGQISNHDALRRRLTRLGAVFQSSADSEALLHLVAASRARTLPERIGEAVRQVDGAYSLLFLDASSLVAVRDPWGVRPLCVGRAPAALGRAGSAERRGRQAVVVASEPCVFDLLGGRAERDLRPGELLVVDRNGIRSVDLGRAPSRHACLFEYVYFARPDSQLDGVDVYELRRASGARLASEQPVAGSTGAPSVVVAVPDTGWPAAVGLAEAAGLPLEVGLGRNHYVGRTFIEPAHAARRLGVRLKLSVNAAAVRGRRVIVVDDSLVRGTTSRELVGMLRTAGAAEVHLRIASPPTAWPCFYGFDTAGQGELLAASHALDALPGLLGADSLGFLSLDGLLDTAARLGSAPLGLCHACFSGHYPLPIPVALGRSDVPVDAARAQRVGERAR